jgi:hypothetical protein
MHRTMVLLIRLGSRVPELQAGAAGAQLLEVARTPAAVARRAP